MALTRCIAALEEIKLEGGQAVCVSIVKRAPAGPILTIAALAAVQTTAGVWTKFIGINLLTIPATFLACELLARRTRVTRFLFGLKPVRP